MAIKFTDNGMFGLKEGGVGSGVIDADVIANNTVTADQLAPTAAGSIIGVHHFKDATHNISTSDAKQSVIIQTSFTRKRTDTSIWAYGFSPIRGQNSYRAGVFLQLDSTMKMEAALFTSPPGNQGDDGVNGMCQYNGVWRPEELAGETTVTVYVGWRSANNSNQRPGNYWNPSQRSARDQDHTTNITFFELLDPCVRTSESADEIQFGE